MTWSIDWVETYTDGSKERTTFTTSDRRKLTVLTDWAVLGGFDYQVLTETPEVELVSSSEKAKENGIGVRFQWVREKRKISTRVSYKRIVLGDPIPPFPTEEQTNEWEAIDPFDCTVSFRGQSYTFPRKEVSISHSIIKYTNYNDKYGPENDELIYTVGDNTISAVAFGVLHCEASFFPPEWGILYEVKQSIVGNDVVKKHNGFVYVWSLHFSEGYVMPVVIRSGSQMPEWHFEYCEKTDETEYNSAYYHKDSNTWKNAIASDGDGGMYWTRNGAIVDFISDNDARKLNWDEGHGTSVHTNRYDLTILPDDGRIKATDTYISENMGSWDGIGEEDADQHVTFNLRFNFGTKGGKVIYDGQEISSLKDIWIESEGPKTVSIQIVPDEGYVLKSVTRNNIDATHYVVDNVLSFSSLSYYTALSFSFEQVETTPPDEEEEEPQEPEEYVNYYDGTLTFYYDDQRSNREGKTFGLYDYKLISDGYKIPSWFDYSNKVTKAVFDASFANSKPNTTSCWFYDFKNLQEVEGIGNLNTSEVTDMSRMFYYCSSLASLDLSHFDTSNVTNMAEMFRYAGDPEFELDVSNFNTSNVTNMRHMFNACSAVSLDLSNFDTSNVTDMSQMFMGTSLTYLDLSSFDTHQVKDMIRMFDSGEFQEIVFSDQYVSSLSTLCDLAFWKDTEKLQTVTYTGDIPESIHSNFYLHVGTEDNPAFLNVPEEYKEHYKEKFDGQKFYGGYFTLGDENNPSHPVSYVSAYVVYKDGTLTFYYDNLRGRRKGTIYSIDQRKNGAPAWVENKESVTKAVFNKSFAKYTSLTSTREWFSGCEKLEAISGIENLKTDNVTDMNCMFANCSSLTSLDLSTFKTENVTNMGWMFLSCSNLNSLDISSFNTNNVTNMYCMFSYCSSLTKLDLSSFNSAKVTSMWGMFQNCKSLTSLDLSSFNTNEVTDMGEMFISCKKLSTIFANEKIWSTAKVEKSANMFTGCSKLVGGNGTKYDSDHTDAKYARIDKADAPGYLSIKGDGNGDGEVDYVDVDMIANYILTHADGYNVKFDINQDGLVNVADIVELINIIKKK